jgi:hypothetical protein
MREIDTGQEAGRVKRRRPRFPWFGKVQLWIGISLVVALIGTMFPWLQTFLGSRPGVDGWGILTAWGAAVGLVGVFSVKRRVFTTMTLLGSVIALGVVLWMAVDGARYCAPVGDGSSPCSFGFGLILSGAAAANAVMWSIRARSTTGG